MKKTGKRLAAVLLAVCMLLGLAACGHGDDKDDTEQLSATVYVPTYQDLDLPFDGVEYACVSGDALYLVGSINEEVTRTETDPDTGEEVDIVEYTNDYEIYRLSADGGLKKLENYQTIQMDKEREDDQIYTYMNSCTPGEDGTIWVEETTSREYFDLPEDFDPETDDQWNYYNSVSVTARRQLDADGNEISRLQIDWEADMEMASGLGLEGASVRRIGGYIIVSNATDMVVLDSQEKELFRLKGEDMWGDIYQLGDGSMCMFFNTYDEETSTSTSVLRTIDMEAQDWGTEYVLPEGVWQIYSAAGDYLFYYQNGDSVYGRKKDATENERLFSWLEADINLSNVAGFGFLSDGRVAAVINNYTDTANIQAAFLTATPRSELAEKTTLTLGMIGDNYEIRDRIIQFNRASTTHRIELRNYAELAGSYEGAKNMLYTEMGAGKVPDILYTGDMPVTQMAAKGLLEDLWPLIDADAELGRDKLMTQPLDAASVDGKLYYIPANFSVSTLLGNSKLVGDRMSWSLADLQEALASAAEGCSIMGQYSTKVDALDILLSMGMESYIDWKTGKCSFDSDAFKALLTFCDQFPAEIDWGYDEDGMGYGVLSSASSAAVAVGPYESDVYRLLTGKQLLTNFSLSNLDYALVQYTSVLGDDYSYVGYPVEDGSVGSAFQFYDSMAISARCADKDAAWSFIRTQLLPQSTEETWNFYSWSFPVNKVDFDQMVANALNPYMMDYETGEILLDENGDPVPRYGEYDTVYLGDEIEPVPMVPLEQADVDKMMALLDSTTRISDWDTRILSLVEDECQAYFAGDVDVDTIAGRIQNKVSLYVGERM